MIFDPPIMALLLLATLTMVAVLAAAPFAAYLLRHWNLESGHARQIRLERGTHLVSTVWMLIMLLQVPALALFVHNADRMAVLFTGAMCAVGTLNVNQWGMPAFLSQVAVFFGALAWLLMNTADNLGKDYPFIRHKYGLLLALAPVVVAAGVMEWLYFLNLDPNVITSCCSRLFTPEGSGVQADLSTFPAKPTLIALFGALSALLVLAGLVWGVGGGAGKRVAAVYGLLGALFFPLAIVAIISVISPYVYETPNHHCPFCILKPQYGFIGYALYAPLFFGSGLALGVFVLGILPMPESVRAALPERLRRWTAASALLLALFGLAAFYAIWRSHLVMFH